MLRFLTAGESYGPQLTAVVLERASARETAARVGAGGVAKALLDKFGGDTVAEVRRAVAAHRRRLR
jgi:chorismate synthase